MWVHTAKTSRGLCCRTTRANKLKWHQQASFQTLSLNRCSLKCWSKRIYRISGHTIPIFQRSNLRGWDQDQWRSTQALVSRTHGKAHNLSRWYRIWVVNQSKGTPKYHRYPAPDRANPRKRNPFHSHHRCSNCLKETLFKDSSISL